MSLSAILTLIRPGAQWVLRDDDYAGLDWRDANQLKPTPEEIAANALAPARAEAIAALLSAVGAARTRYAPSTAFQGPAYDIKAAEADAYVAAGRPADVSAFPLLAASAAANNRSVSAHADLVLAKRDAWIPLLAATENLREAGENAIKAADTAEAINAARDAYVGQLAQI